MKNLFLLWVVLAAGGASVESPFRSHLEASSERVRDWLGQVDAAKLVVYVHPVYVRYAVTLAPDGEPLLYDSIHP